MKKVNIQFKFSNRFLYTFIVTVIMILVGVMVFAYTGNVGHTSSQIDESDPTVASSVKDGVSWSELSGIPLGFEDGVDNEGISGVSWSQISGIPSGFADGTDNEGISGVSWSQISGIPSGFADNVDNEGSGGGGSLSFGSSTNVVLGGNNDAWHYCPSGYVVTGLFRKGTDDNQVQQMRCTQLTVS